MRLPVVDQCLGNTTKVVDRFGIEQALLVLDRCIQITMQKQGGRTGNPDMCNGGIFLETWNVLIE